MVNIPMGFSTSHARNIYFAWPDCHFGMARDSIVARQTAGASWLKRERLLRRQRFKGGSASVELSKN